MKMNTMLKRRLTTVAELEAAARPSSLLTDILKKMERENENKIESSVTKRDKAFSRLAHQIVGAETL